MEDNLINNMNEMDMEYAIVIQRCDDILYDLEDDPKERLIYESIIDGIERSAAEAIKDGKVAQLPSIGCIRKSPIRQAMRDNYNNFRLARKNLTKEQYQEHVRCIVIDAKEKLEQENALKLLNKKVRSRNKKRYDLLYITLGKAYAEMYIQSILMLKEVPYILAVQEQYDKLNGL